MKQLSKVFDELIINITVKAMLDPENEYFYLPNLTLEKGAELCAGDPDKTAIFWKALHIAENIYNQRLEEQSIEEAFAIVNDVTRSYNFEHSCPECHYYRYIAGVRCPNCDYVEQGFVPYSIKK